MSFTTEQLYIYILLIYDKTLEVKNFHGCKKIELLMEVRNHNQEAILSWKLEAVNKIRN